MYFNIYFLLTGSIESFPFRHIKYFPVNSDTDPTSARLRLPVILAQLLEGHVLPCREINIKK